MIYKYNLKSNKKAYIPFIAIFGCVLAGASTFLYLSRIVATIIFVIALWAAFKMYSSMKTILNSRIETFTDGFCVYVSDGTKLDFEWNLVTHAGHITNNDFYFAYEESLDRIVQLPNVFTDFDTFIEELKQNTPYKEYDLADGETIIDWLKKELGVTTADSDESEDSSEDDSEKTEDTAQQQTE